MNLLKRKRARASSGSNQVIDNSTTSTLSHYSYAVRISSKMCNVLLCPLDGSKCIPHTSIRYHILARGRYPSRSAKTVIRAHRDELLIGLRHFLKKTSRVAGLGLASNTVLLASECITKVALNEHQML